MPGGPPFRVALIVFDVDGTLIDFAGALRTALVETAREASRVAGAELDPRALQEGFRAVYEEPAWRARNPWAARRESMRRALAERGLEDNATLDALVEHYRETRDRSLTVYPDVLDALEELRGAGFPMRAATNGNMDLAPLGLAHYFETIEMAHDLGVSKPDPRFYARVVERAGVAPSMAVAVGDRVDNDYEPARAAGLHSVLLDRSMTGPAPEDASMLRIGALTELAALIERATGA